MNRIEQTVFIEAPIEEVFRIASDWQRWEQWFVDVGGYEPTTDITRGNGAIYTYTASMLGISARFETEITEFREPHGWVGVGTKAIAHRSIWVFRESSGGTEFTYAIEYRLPLLAALVHPLLRRQWQRIILQSVLNLEQLVTEALRCQALGT
jgi:hypothetical protein